MGMYPSMGTLFKKIEERTFTMKTGVVGHHLSVMIDLVNKGNEQIRENCRFTMSKLSVHFPEISLSILYEKWKKNYASLSFVVVGYQQNCWRSQNQKNEFCHKLCLKFKWGVFEHSPDFAPSDFHLIPIHLSGSAVTGGYKRRRQICMQTAKTVKSYDKCLNLFVNYV